MGRVYLSYLQIVLQKSRGRIHLRRGVSSFKLVYVLVNKFDAEGSDDGAAEQFLWLVVGVVVGGNEVVR